MLFCLFVVELVLRYRCGGFLSYSFFLNLKSFKVLYFAVFEKLEYIAFKLFDGSISKFVKRVGEALQKIAVVAYHYKGTGIL